MAENSKIEWTDHTFNPWIGCTKVSDGCKHCYAETLMDKRMGKVQWGPQGTRVRTSAANWKKPLTWNKQEWWECLDCGYRGSVYSFDDYCPECRGSNCKPTRQRVFCASLADVFEIQPGQPEMAQWRMDLFELIRLTPNLDWLLLTKRPENVMISEPVHKAQRLPDNAWIGTSVENQQTADERIPELLKVPAKVRFLSMEPLLGAVDISEYLPFEYYVPQSQLTNYLDDGSRWANEDSIHWVIVGGESGHEARPMHPDWARYLRDQCVASGVAFHFKQWGEWVPYSQATTKDQRERFAAEQKPGGTQTYWGARIDIGPQGPITGTTPGVSPESVARIGKAAAGRMLDGRTWDEFPKDTK